MLNGLLMEKIINYILQTRPETIHSNKEEGKYKVEKYVLKEKTDILLKGVLLEIRLVLVKLKF